jgi:serine/threonine protein kinase
MTDPEDIPDVRSTLFRTPEPGDAKAAPVECFGSAATQRAVRELLGSLADSDRRRKYLSEGIIGRGGMGAVYRVVDTDLKRSLAMKVLLASDEPDRGRKLDPLVLARFLDEAQVTGQLDHPGIVPLHEVGIDGQGRIYFTMRLVRGHHLGEVFAMAREGKEGWTPERCVGALVKVCEAMAYAHSKGVVHRDLKPQNVMAGRFGEVYVMDWGLAKVRGRTDRATAKDESHANSMSLVQVGKLRESGVMTMAGSVFGTPCYMAPEQARGEVERVDAASDVYSLGAMLYHLLCGEAPYLADGARLPAATVLQCVLGGPPPKILAIAKDAPRDLAAICEKAMAREPQQRYGDMLALADDLRAWLAGRPVAARPLSAVARGARFCRRYPLVAASLFALVLGAGFGVSRLTTLGRELVLDATRDAAQHQAEMLEMVNALYAEEVVSRVDRDHVEVTHDWQAKASAIPIPASFLTALAARISSSGDVVVRHYSDHPFGFRGDADLDDFGREALARLRVAPDTAVERVEPVDGRPVLRYAVARRMAQSCVTCHNEHPDSTKTDWRVGDVRGVLEIQRPLADAERQSRAGVQGTILGMALLVVGLAALGAFALLRATRAS